MKSRKNKEKRMDNKSPGKKAIRKIKAPAWIDFFRIDAFLITLNIFLFVWLLTLIPFNLGFLDPVGKALSDFDMYDIYFSRLRSEPETDTSIVIVNIGNLNRAGIAKQIRNLSRFHPKVIGLDALFEVKRESQSDSLLAEALANSRNMVLVSRLDFYDEKSNCYDSLKTAIDIFSRHTMNGYANFPDDMSHSFRTIRNFVPFADCRHMRVPSFEMKIFELVNKKGYLKFLERGNEYEMINYRGNYNKFYFIDAAECLDENTDLTVVRNKIVLMGYLGPDISSKTLEDVFFTPLNEKYAGRTFPDMYGIVIHANILSMLMHGNFIDNLPFGWGIAFAFLVGYINTLMLLYTKKKLYDWFGGITKLILFFQTLLNMLVVVFVFSRYNFRINLTLAIAVIFLVPTSIDIYLNYIEKLYRVILRKYKRDKK